MVEVPIASENARLLQEALETAKSLRRYGVLSEPDMVKVRKLCKQSFEELLAQSQPLDAEFAKRIRGLTQGVEVDLDAPLSSDDEDHNK
jgi:hypothetical protein